MLRLPLLDQTEFMKPRQGLHVLGYVGPQSLFLPARMPVSWAGRADRAAKFCLESAGFAKA
jgi:hypothetical protein